MEKITNLEYKKEDSESTRQEKNRILVNREILSLFSYPMAKLQEKEIISFEDIENLYYTDEQIIKYNNLNGVSEEDLKQEIEKIRDNGEDQQEIYEYWIVTEWFYEKLKELNEPVIEWENLYIWGRTCTGQSIALDYTIDDIRKTLG